MRLAVLVSACLLALSAPAARADFLNTPGDLAQGWAALAPRIPAGAAILRLEAHHEGIEAYWRGAAPRGGVERLRLRPASPATKGRARVEGPGWDPVDPPADAMAFGLADLAPLAAIDTWLAHARIAAKLGPDARFEWLEVAHPVEDSDHDGLAFGFWLSGGGYERSVGLDPTGRVVWVMTVAGSVPDAPVVPAAQPEPSPRPVVATPEPEPDPPAAWRGDSGRDLVAGLAAFAAHLGPDARIWEVDARPDRITIDRPHPTQPRTTAILTLTERGFREERTFPQMMQTDADLFPLSALAGLTPEAVEAARAVGLAGVALPGGQVARLRIWSGAPFWRHPAGEPFFDIRVEVPPGNLNGYGVVTLGGQLVEAIR